MRRYLLIAAALIFPLGLLVVALQGYVVRNAVVTAELVELRAPISGDITTFAVKRGAYLAGDQVVVTIADPRRDRRAVEALTVEIDRAAAELKARQADLATLEAESAALDKRLDQSLASLHSDLALQQEIALAQRGGLEARIEFLTKQYDRAKRLQGTAASQSAMEQADAAVKEASADLQALDLTIERLAQQQGYLTQDLLIADLADDAIALAAYGRDLDDRRRDAALAVALLETRVAAARQALESEQRHLSAVGGVELRLPSDSVVWEVHKNAGSSVAQGVELLTYISCDARFVEAAVDDSTVDLLQPDHRVTVHLYGSDEPLEGRINLVYGSSGGHSAQRGLAAHLSELGGNDAVVLIEIEPAHQVARERRLCDIGRTAYVEFDGIGLLDPLINRIF